MTAPDPVIVELLAAIDQHQPSTHDETDRADVVLVCEAIRSAPPCPHWGKDEPALGMLACIVCEARAVLTALAEAGRLLPPDADTRWSVRFADGTVLETSGFTEAGARQRAEEMTRFGDLAEPVCQRVGPWLAVKEEA